MTVNGLWLGAVTAQIVIPWVRQYDYAVSLNPTPYVAAYTFGGVGTGAPLPGWGTRYANPSTLPPFTCYSLDFTPSGNAISLGGGFGTGYLYTYSWTKGTGFGSKYTDSVTTFNNAIRDVDFNTAGTVILTSGNDGAIAFPWSISGYGAKYADPSPLPGQVRSGKFNTAGTAVVLAIAGSPYIYAYLWSSGFSTKYTDPAAPPIYGYRIGFNPADNLVAIAYPQSPNVSVYPWSPGFGAKYANPATLPTGQGLNVQFSPSGNTIMVTHSSAPYVSAYSWSSGFGSKYADPAIPVGSGASNDAYALVFTPAGTSVVIGSIGSPYINGYMWTDGSGFGLKYNNPVSAANVVYFGSAFTDN